MLDSKIILKEPNKEGIAEIFLACNQSIVEA
jgi:hypothetical protein